MVICFNVDEMNLKNVGNRPIDGVADTDTDSNLKCPSDPDSNLKNPSDPYS